MFFIPSTEDEWEAGTKVFSIYYHGNHGLHALVAGFDLSSGINLIDREFQQTGICEYKTVVILLNLQYAIEHEVGMNDGIGQGFTYCLMLRRVIFADDSFHSEWTG